MNLIQIKDFLFKRWKEIVIVILTISCILQCESNNTLDKKLINTEKEKAIHQSNAKHYLDLNDSLNLKIPKYEDSIFKLKKLNEENVKNILNLKKQTNLKLIKVKNYTSKDIKKYFEERYKVIDIPLETQGVVLKDSISHLVITDLIKGDSSIEELKITNKMLFNEKEQSKQKDSIIINQNKQIINSDIIISEKDKINALSEKAFKDTKEALKKQQKNKNIWKYIAIGSSAVAGSLILIK